MGRPVPDAALLPTPMANEGEKATNQQTAEQRGQTGQVYLTNVVQSVRQAQPLLPTPDVASGQRSPESFEKGDHQVSLHNIGDLLPTPRAQARDLTRREDYRHNLEEALGNQFLPLMPTPDAYAGSRGGSSDPDARRAAGRTVTTADVVEHKLMPTPLAAAGQGGCTVSFGDTAKGLPSLVKTLPTPTTQIGTEPDVANQMLTRAHPGLDSITGLLGMPVETWRRSDPAGFRDDSRAAEIRAQQAQQARRSLPGWVQDPLALDLDAEAAELPQTLPTPTVLDDVEKRTTYAGGGLTLQGVVGGVNPKDYDRMQKRGAELQDWRVLPTPTAHNRERSEAELEQRKADRPTQGPNLDEVPRLINHDEGRVNWGDYEPAIRRWEAVMGPAPAPTELSPRGSHRLSARFTEWMMGQPPGWITDTGISRNDQLKACGNGVVTQQAIAAITDMLAAYATLEEAA